MENLFNKKLISVIVPVFNEEKNIPFIFNSLEDVFNKKISEYDYEIIFVNDGSIDNSESIIDDMSRENKKIKLINFSRNFGKEIATTAGFHCCSGDAVFMIDADLQHPPEIIPEFIKKWEEGFEVVVGVRTKNKGEGFIKKFGSFCFYKIMNKISETKITEKATDFRLLDRKVVDAFNKFTERGRMTRGIIDWLGFKRTYIKFKANERKEGKSLYSRVKLIKLALSAIVANSLFPLKLAGYLGLFIIGSASLFGLFILVEKFILNDPLNLYFSSLALLVTLSVVILGIILSCLGLIALYIANIKIEVSNRPIYIISKKVNFSNENV